MTTSTMQSPSANVVDDGWRLPDALWERLEPLLPKHRIHRKGGRPPLPWRCVLDGVFFVLRTGCQWKAVPKAFGSGSSLHRYFQSLVRRRLFRKLWQIALEEYDDLKGIDWEWQAIDGCMTKAPLGGKKDGEKPHGSSKKGNQTLAADGWPGSAFGPGRKRRQSPGPGVAETDPGEHPSRKAATDAREAPAFLW
jgi:transposase